MLMNIILWIIFGALIGWLASVIMRTDEQQGPAANVGIGIIGALIGGAIGRVFGGSGSADFSLGSLVLGVLGAVILIFFLKLFTRGTTHRRGI